jgi:hypothetical protein
VTLADKVEWLILIMLSAYRSSIIINNGYDASEMQA